MAKRKMFFVFNTKAGKGKIRNTLSDIIDIFIRAGYSVTVHSTQSKGDAKKMVKHLDDGQFELVVCSGGDGTLDEVVSGMMLRKEKLPIGYIPAGSTNDFARSLGISNEMAQAAKDIVDGSAFPVDIGRFNDDIFVYVAAFGMFTEVSYATDQQMKNVLGHLAYILEGVKSLSMIKSYRMEIECEDRALSGDYIYGMITNSARVGGFKNITGKNILLDDGQFEVTLVKLPSTPNELNDTVSALLRQEFDSPCIQCFKASSLKVVSQEEVSWTLDGEFGGSHREVLIRNENKAVTILAPVSCQQL